MEMDIEFDTLLSNPVCVKPRAGPKFKPTRKPKETPLTAVSVASPELVGNQGPVNNSKVSPLGLASQPEGDFRSEDVEIEHRNKASGEGSVANVEAPIISKFVANEKESFTFKRCNFLGNSEEFVECQERVNVEEIGTSEYLEPEAYPDLENLTNGGYNFVGTENSPEFVESEKLGTSEFVEAEAYLDLEGLDFACETTGTVVAAKVFPPEGEYLDEGLTSAPPLYDLVTTSQLESAGTDPPFEDPMAEELTNLAGASESNDSPIISAPEPPLEYPITEELTDFTGASEPADFMPSQAAESHDSPVISGKQSTKRQKKRKKDVSGEVYVESIEEIHQVALDDIRVSPVNEGNGAGKSPRRLRKRASAPIVDDGMDDETAENGNQNANSPKYCLFDEEENNCDPEYQEEASQRNRAPRKTMKGHNENVHDGMDDETAKNGNQNANSPEYCLFDEDDNNDDDPEYQEEPSQRKSAQRKTMKVAHNNKRTKRPKNSSDGQATSSKEPSKRKFSHSTRRNRRQVSSVLLETPEDEIDHQRLIIKDLILLAEIKERKTNRSAAAPENSFDNQGQNSDNGEARIRPDSPIHNYHTYMDKTPRGRWSKQDTDLLYEAIRQFGTNFAMIQLLFPGRTRQQVKSKYKKEERQNPSMLFDALNNPSKSHCHFELVIEKLTHEADEAEDNYERDVESFDVSGEMGVSPKSNDEVVITEQTEEVGKSKGHDEEVNGDMEVAEVTQDHDTVRNDHDAEDDHWNESESDFEDYVGY